jgi:glycine hydroxymethyltransferase
MREVALREKPKMLIAGFSAYSRDLIMLNSESCR